MKVFYTDRFFLSPPEIHTFPIDKYALLMQRIIKAKIVAPTDVYAPVPVTFEELLRVLESEYLERIIRGKLTLKEIRRIGSPWSLSPVERSMRSCGDTLQACREALVDGIAVNLAGGTHHAFADSGEGYCVFNDCAVAARSMQSESLARRIVILDCDVHQGNGTAAIFSRDSTVFTFSIHGEKISLFTRKRVILILVSKIVPVTTNT